nr:zinc finger, CCHC-type [Tanacetum cinerariifolium]
VKEYQKKDKIESKPDKNGKRGEAGKSQKQLQSIKQEKLKKMQKEGPEMQTHSKLFKKDQVEGPLFVRERDRVNLDWDVKMAKHNTTKVMAVGLREVPRQEYRPDFGKLNHSGPGSFEHWARKLRWPPKVTLGRLLPHARGLGFKPRRGGFPSGAKKEWGLSPKAKVRVLHTAQLDVTCLWFFGVSLLYHSQAKRIHSTQSAALREQGNVSLQCPKLTETNYTTWALIMETILKAYGIWETIVAKEGVATNEKNENTSKAIIFQTLQQDMLMQVAQYTTAKETLRSELETLKMKPHESTSEFAGKLSSIQAKFKSFGGTLKDKVLVRKLLNLVPKKFLPIVASIEQYQEIDTMQFEEAVGRITAFKERLKSQDEPENNSQNKLLLASSNNQGGGRGHGRNFTKNKSSYDKCTIRGSINKSKIRCYECGEHGHFAKECTK